MNLKASITIWLFLISSTLSFAQFKDHCKIGISLFRIEKNSVTQVEQFEPKLVTNLAFETGWKSFRFTANAEYAANRMHENCRTCADVPMGDSWMREFNFYLGVKYIFLSHNQFPVKPFVEFRGISGCGNYEGIFTGGWLANFQVSQQFRTYIAGLNLGFEIILGQHLRVSYHAFYHVGKGWYDDTRDFNLTKDYQRTTNYNCSPFGCTVSYHF